MTSPSQESTVEIIVEENKVVKIRKAPYRYLPDGTYDNKPLSPTYFRDYYRIIKMAYINIILDQRNSKSYVKH